MMEKRISVTKIEILMIFIKRINKDHVKLTNTFCVKSAEFGMLQ